MMLPVASYYRTADLAGGRFDMQVDALITPDVLEVADRLADPGSAVAFVTIEPAVILGNGREADRASVFLTSTPDRIRESWFPDDATLSGPARVGDDWVDVSANVARLLGVAPGDQIALEFLGERIPLTVRRVMAVSRQGFKNVAVGVIGPRMTDALQAAENGATPTVLVMRTTRSVDEVYSALAEVARASDLQVTTRMETMASQEPDLFGSQAVQGAVTLLGLAILVALAMREGASIAHRRRRDITVLWAVGATPRQLVGAVVALEAMVVLVAFPVAYILVRMAYDTVLGPAIPPSLLLPLQLGFVLAAVSYLLVLAESTRRKLRAELAHQVLTQP